MCDTKPAKGLMFDPAHLTQNLELDFFIELFRGAAAAKQQSLGDIMKSHETIVS